MKGTAEDFALHAGHRDLARRLKDHEVKHTTENMFVNMLLFVQCHMIYFKRKFMQLHFATTFQTLAERRKSVDSRRSSVASDVSKISNGTKYSPPAYRNGRSSFKERCGSIETQSALL